MTGLPLNKRIAHSFMLWVFHLESFFLHKLKMLINGQASSGPFRVLSKIFGKYFVRENLHNLFAFYFFVLEKVFHI
jgi:hypothetical protein